MTTIRACALIAIAALLGCQQGDPPAREKRPAGFGADDMATVDAMAQFVAGLRDAIDSSRGDCDRMAAALVPVMERGKPALEKARALEKKLEANQPARDWIQEYVEHRSGGFDAIAKGVGACAEHPGVQQALASFIQ